MIYIKELREERRGQPRVAEDLPRISWQSRSLAGSNLKDRIILA